MKKNGFLLFIIILGLAANSGVADEVFPVGYTYVVNHSGSYPDSGHTAGGLGELTDGVWDATVWGGGNSPTSSDVVPLVGWFQTVPTVEFDFGSIFNVKSATFWFADSDNAAGVNYPSSITLRNSDSSFVHTENFSNPAGAGAMVPINLSSFDVSTDKLIVEVGTVGGQHTMLSEVRFSSVPEPSSGVLFGLTVAGIALRRRRRIQR